MIAVGGGRGCGIRVWFTREKNYIGMVLFIKPVVRIGACMSS